MDIDELCEIVNRALTEAGIEVTDGRTAQTVTPRNVRYYRTIGLLEPPRRAGGRASYDDGHVRAIVAIKQAQAAGRSLEDLKPNPPDAGLAGLVVARARHDDFSSPTLRTVSHWAALSSPAQPPEWPSAHPSTTDLGWSVRVGEAILSGFGPPPDAATLRRLTEILDGTAESDAT